MANNGKIRFLRANASDLDSTKKLTAGQPLYIADKNYLTVGNLNDDNKASNAQPIDARRIHGYTSDNNTLNNTNTGEYKVEPYIFDTNKSGLLIKAPDEIKLEADKVSATEFTGNLKGNVTGNVVGNLNGNADTVTNGVYTTDFNTARATKFGDYIVEKKKLLWSSISGQSSDSPQDTDITLNESVAIGDILEVEMSFGIGRIFHKFEVVDISGNVSAQLCQPQLWSSDDTERATRQVRNNYCSIYLKSSNELSFSYKRGTWYTFEGPTSTTASFTFSGGSATLFKVYKIISENISSGA